MSKKNDYKVREFKVKINFHTYGCITKKEMEEKTEKLKKEFDKIIDRPVDKDLYRGLGSIDPRLKE